MKLIIFIPFLFLVGCAAFTRRNVIEIENQKLNSAKRSGMATSVGEVHIEAADYDLKIFNLNSSTAYLSIGPLVPLIPMHPFRDLTSDGTFKLELIVEPKNQLPVSVDFSQIAFEDFPMNYAPRGKFTVSEILESKNDYRMTPFEPELKDIKSSGRHFYQIVCQLNGRSIPENEGPFLKIKGLKVAVARKTWDVPDLLLKYSHSYHYEFFRP